MMVFNIRAKVHALGYHCNSSALTFAIHRGRVAEDTGELDGFASSTLPETNVAPGDLKKY